MAELTLHCFAQSGNAYKAALMLELCGIEWTPRFVDFFGGETRSEAYREVNPMGEVPVLETGDMTLSQSAVILDYIAGETGKFGAQSVADGREILRWLFWDNHKLTGYTATYRFLKNFTAAGENQVTKFLEDRVYSAFKILDKHLTGRKFVVGDSLSIADISLCGYLFWDDEIGVNWADYPGIDTWLQRIKVTPGWVHPYKLMPGHPLPS